MEPLDVASLLAEPAPLSWERLQATNGSIDDSPPADGDELDRALPWLVRHLGVADALALVMAADADAAAAAGLPDAPAPGVLAVVPADAPSDGPADDEAFARALALAQAEARAEAEAQAAARALAEAEALAAAEARALAAARDGIPAWPAEPAADDGLDLSAGLAHLARAGLLRAPPAAADPGPAPESPDDETDGAGRLLGALGLIGFSGRLQVQPLADLSPLQLPMLLLLRCGDACVLTRIDDRRAERILHVVMPGHPPVAFDLPEATLQAEYTGAALLLQRLDDSSPLALPAGSQGPLARLALALHAALSEPVPGPSRWRRLWDSCMGLLGAARVGRRKSGTRTPACDGAFKFAPGRPISG